MSISTLIASSPDGGIEDRAAACDIWVTALPIAASCAPIADLVLRGRSIAFRQGRCPSPLRQDRIHVSLLPHALTPAATMRPGTCAVADDLGLAIHTHLRGAGRNAGGANRYDTGSTAGLARIFKSDVTAHCTQLDR